MLFVRSWEWRMSDDRDPADGPESLSDLTESMPPHGRPSENIGPYRLLEKTGEGGMGEVWLAEQTRPVRRKVALKVIKRGRPQAHGLLEPVAPAAVASAFNEPRSPSRLRGVRPPAQTDPSLLLQPLQAEPVETNQ
jgi:serine/threonine protein kinase